MSRFREFVRRITGRFLLTPALAGVMAVMLYYLTGNVLSILLLLIVTCAVAYIMRREVHPRNSLIFACLICLIVMLSLYFSSRSEMPEFGKTYEIEAKVVSVNRKLSGRSTIRLKTEEFGLLEYSIADESGSIPEAGSMLRIKCILSEPDKPSNPGEFDYPAYLARQGIRYQVRIISAELLRQENPLMSRINAAGRSMFHIRQKITGLFGDEKALAAAVFLGDTSLTDKETSSVFRRMGCSHLLAVSGTHFSGFLAVPAMLGVSKGSKNRRFKIVFVLFCILLGVFTGWSPSVTRAAIMSSCACCSRDAVSGMSLAALIMIIADPMSAVSSGFLMSFAACLGILILSPAISSALISKGLKRDPASVISAVLSAQAGMLPFNLTPTFRYGVIPVAVQLTASIIAQCACIFFLPSVILTLIFGDVFTAPAKLMIVLLRSFLAVVSRIYTGSSISPLCSLAILSLISLVFLPKSFHRNCVKIISLVLCAVNIGLGISSLIDPVRVKVIFIDVGQGDSCLILSGGRSLLIDGGTYDSGADHVAPVLDYYCIDTVDIALATHLDEDHAGGIRYLMECGRISQVLTPAVCDGMSEISAGDLIELSKCCTVSVLYPDDSIEHDGENEDSLVCLIDANNTRILMTGDIGTETEEKLVSAGIIEDIDILKVAHHGSSYSTCNIFLDECAPEYAVISVGRHNDYGHPAPDTMRRLREHNADIYTTAECGAVTVEIGNRDFSIRPYSRI